MKWVAHVFLLFLGCGVALANDNHLTFTGEFMTPIIKVGARQSLSIPALPVGEQEVKKRSGKSTSRPAQPTSPAPAPPRPPEAATTKSDGNGQEAEEISKWELGDEPIYHQYKKLNQAGKFAEAIPLAKELISLGEKRVGVGHVLTAVPLNNLATLYIKMGRHEEAETLLVKANKIEEKAYGRDHKKSLTTLSNLSGVYVILDREEALPLLERVLAVTEKAFGHKHESTAASMDNLAFYYFRKGQLAKAEPLCVKALGIREEALGLNHPKTAASLNNLSQLYQKIGRYEEAEPLAAKALKIAEKTFGENHPTTASACSTLGSLNLYMGRFEKSQSLYVRALSIQEAVFGKNHPNTLTTLNNLAALNQARGQFQEAESLMERALVIVEKSVGRNHPGTLTTMVNLAKIYTTLGRSKDSAQLIKRAHKICVDAFGPDHPNVALVLHSLGDLNQSMNHYEAAESPLRQAIVIYENKYGPDHPSLASVQNSLALVLVKLGKIDEAEALYENIAIKLEQTLGLNHLDTTKVLGNLGGLYSRNGRPEEAAIQYGKALEGLEKAVGSSHPDTATCLQNLAIIHRELHNDQKALRYVKEAQDADRAVLRQVLSFSTEVERLAFRNTANYFHTVANIPTAGAETAEAVLQFKGIVLESIIEDREMALAAKDPEVNLLFEALAKNRSILRRVRLQGNTSGLKPDEVDHLEEEFRKQEKNLVKRIAGLGGARASLDLRASEVAAALPKDSTLIEYFFYGQYLGRDRWKQSYGAVVIPKAGPPTVVHCCSTEELEKALDDFHLANRNFAGDLAEESLRRLHELLIEPLQEQLEGVGRIIVCPDADLNFVPFSVLLDKEDRFLAEQYEIGYVAGGRDLLKESHAEKVGIPVLVGGPSFQLDTATSNLAAAGEGAGTSHLLATRAIDKDDLSSIRLVDLPGAKDEAGRISSIFGQSRGGSHVVTGGEATEEEVRNVKSPIVLHLATHGFFMAPVQLGETNPDVMRSGSGDFLKPTGPINNPMYLSGIALAGAQDTIEKWKIGEVPDPASDGILMGAEVSDLNLRGTDLVTLSACNTATGNVRDGEGVLGLRRGFVMAGAKNLLMTLWPITDEDTADFMEDFYGRYAESGDAPGSLARVQREWLIRLREEKGLMHAVNRVGPFIISSQGKLD